MPVKSDAWRSIGLRPRAVGCKLAAIEIHTEIAIGFERHESEIAGEGLDPLERFSLLRRTGAQRDIALRAYGKIAARRLEYEIRSH